MTQYRLIHYFDVWGNKDDGWEINNQHEVFNNLDIPHDFDYKKILTYLKEIGFLVTNDMRRLLIEEHGNSIEVYERKNMKPICMLSPVERSDIECTNIDINTKSVNTLLMLA